MTYQYKTLNFFHCISRIPAKKVIIRQGHRAENFYFVVSGTGKFQSKTTQISVVLIILVINKNDPIMITTIEYRDY